MLLSEDSSKNKIGEDSPILKFTYLKIWRRDDVESLTTLEEGEFKVTIDSCINMAYILISEQISVEIKTWESS